MGVIYQHYKFNSIWRNNDFPGREVKTTLVDKNVHIEIQDYKNVNKRQQRTYLLHRKKIISME